MATPNESSVRTDLLGIAEEEVDYGSDVESKVSTPMRVNVTMQAPNLFPERRVADALAALHVTLDTGSAIIAKPLDEQQKADP